MSELRNFKPTEDEYEYILHGIAPAVTSIRLWHDSDRKRITTSLTPMQIIDGCCSFSITAMQFQDLLPIARKSDKMLLATAQALDAVVPEVALLFADGQHKAAKALLVSTLRPPSDDSTDPTSAEHRAPFSTLKPSTIEAILSGKVRL